MIWSRGGEGLRDTLRNEGSKGVLQKELQKGGWDEKGADGGG